MRPMSFQNNVAGAVVAGTAQPVVVVGRGRSLRASMIKVVFFCLTMLAAGIAFASFEAIGICSAALKANFCP
jgi:hypothetical protein